MADVFSAGKRSAIMSHIRSRDTKPELFVRRLLFAAGYRYRICRNDLPGRPDLTLTKYKTVIFVNGCFWHRHEGCPRATTPSDRNGYWSSKFKRNIDRDASDHAELRRMGWRVLVVWECACGMPRAQSLLTALEAFLTGDALYGEIGRRWNRNPGVSEADGGLCVSFEQAPPVDA